MTSAKSEFSRKLKEFVKSLNGNLSCGKGEWTIKGFIDVYKNIYTISTDTKIISKILEIHIFPLILKFAEDNDYIIILADHQNYYPDMTFISKKNSAIKFAVDFKTTYRKEKNPLLCNGFTLGSHGEYFQNRGSQKNIQFPYSEYKGHFCLGIIYDRNHKKDIDETKIFKINKLHSITSVISNFTFFAAEKWKIAKDTSGSGNTANIGSITVIEDILNEKGTFIDLGEEWFDDYWMNYNKITIKNKDGKTKKIRNLKDFIIFRNKENK